MSIPLTKRTSIHVKGGCGGGGSIDSQLVFPEKIYGRDNDLKKLHFVYEKLCSSMIAGGEEQVLPLVPMGQNDQPIHSTSDSTSPMHPPPTEFPVMPIKEENDTPLILVSGYSGSGKSSLVNTFMEQLERQARIKDSKIKPCYLLSGKFHEHSVGVTYSALVEAFGGFCDEILKGDTAELQRLKGSITEAVGDEGSVLANMIPKLAPLIGKKDSEQSSKHFSMENGYNRLRYILKSFTEAICNADRPVVLFLDDLQWIDDASSELMVDLATNKCAGRFMFIGAYRSNNVDENPVFANALAKIRDARRTLQINLSGLSLVVVEEFIADTLRLEAGECSDLAEQIYSKTQGNIFFTKQTLEALHRKRAIYKSILDFQWCWDMEKVSAVASYSDNVVDLVTAKITSLPEKLQKVLAIASFLGSNFTFDILFGVIENEGYQMLSQDLVQLLDIGVHKGLIVERSTLSEYAFAHDRIKQACYSLMPIGENRDAIKVRIAKYLIKMAKSKEGKAWMLFVAADHLNAVDYHDMTPLEVVRLNLEVGEKAVALSAFVPASVYLQKASEALESIEHPWKLHYDMTLRLCRTSADVELLLGRFERGRMFCNEVITHTRSVEDKLAMQLSLGQALGRLERHAEGMTVNMLALLSVKQFPAGFYLFHVLRDFRIVKKYFQAHTDYDILMLPPMRDRVKVAAMEHLSDLIVRAYSCGYTIIVLLSILRSLRLSFKHGVCAATAGAFAYYGLILCGTFGDQEEGSRLGRLAKEILVHSQEWDRIKAKHFECCVLCNTAIFM